MLLEKMIKYEYKSQMRRRAIGIGQDVMTTPRVSVSSTTSIYAGYTTLPLSPSLPLYSYIQTKQNELHGMADSKLSGDKVNEERAFIKRYTEGISGRDVAYQGDFSTPLEDRPRKVAVIGVSEGVSSLPNGVGYSCIAGRPCAASAPRRCYPHGRLDSRDRLT